MSVSSVNVKFHQVSPHSPSGMEEFNPSTKTLPPVKMHSLILSPEPIRRTSISESSSVISDPGSNGSSPILSAKASPAASASSDSTVSTPSSPEDSVSSESSDSSNGSQSLDLEERLRQFYKEGDILSSPGKPAYQERMKKSFIRREVTRLVDPCGNPFRKSNAQLPWVEEKDGQVKIHFHKKQKGYVRDLFTKLSDALGGSVTMDLDDKMTRKRDREYHLSISISAKHQRAFKRMLSLNTCLPVFCMG